MTHKAITRRDFLNGTALVISGVVGANLTACDNHKPSNKQPQSPLQTGNSNPAKPPVQSGDYPPKLMGLRGDHEGSYDVAHKMAWQKQVFDVSSEPVLEVVDLVVVGAGVSGLAAAYFYQKKFPNAKILILDNHDDFGGHAKRNEFLEMVDGKEVFRLSFGGSESIDTPSEYSDESANLLKELGVDLQKFYEYYDQDFFKNLGMKDGVFFNQANFGKSVVIGDVPTADNAAQFFTKTPLSSADQVALIELYAKPQDYLPNLSKSQQEKYLKSISYDKFLTENAKLSDTAMDFMAQICLEYWGVNTDGLSAYDAFVEGYAGFDGLKLDGDDDEGQEEPYIFHFPDGNASIARLLVKKMIPTAILNPDNSNGKSPMEAIVLDKFDYNKLDVAGQAVNLRLSATAVQVVNLDNGVMVGYQKDNKTYRVDAKHSILACQHSMIPYLDKAFAVNQADFGKNVRVPMLYTKVLVKDWTAFKKLGVKELYAPKSPYCLVMVDYPVNMGGYEFPKQTNEPMVVHMVRMPIPYKTGKDVRETCKMGRAELYGKSFAELEKQALDQLAEIYQVAGESLDDKVLAVTINRWGHGYSYEKNRLFDSETDSKRILATVKQPYGNIHLANSDADWFPYLNGAIDQAWRAVDEIDG